MDLFVQKGLAWHIKDQITRRRLVNGCLQESTLDQLLTSNEHMIEKLELSAHLGRSDHLVMNATFTLANDMQYAAPSKRIWSKCDEQKVDFMGKNTNWSSSVTEWDIEGMWDELHSKVIAISDECTPIKTIRCTNGSEICKLPWDCSKLKRLRKQKNQKWKEFEDSPTNINLLYVLDSQRVFGSTELELKLKYERKLAKGVKHNPKALFSYVRSKRAVNDRVVPVKRPDSNSKTKTAKESAKLLANYFASVFTNEPFGPLRKECYASIPGVSHIGVMQIDDKEVYRLINSLNIHKSQGPEEIHSLVLKMLSKNPMFVRAVGCMFRSCAFFATIRDIWKRAVVIPIFKKGCRSDASSYRPISLTYILCKVYETRLRNHILQHVQG